MGGLPSSAASTGRIYGCARASANRLRRRRCEGEGGGKRGGQPAGVPCHRVFICSPRAPRKTHAPPRRPCVPLFDRQRRGERGTRKHAEAMVRDGTPSPRGDPTATCECRRRLAGSRRDPPSTDSRSATPVVTPARAAAGIRVVSGRGSEPSVFRLGRPAAVGAWASRSVSVYFSVITAHSTHVASAANYLAQRCWANTNSDRKCPAFSTFPK